MKRKHCQKSRMNGRFCKILRESGKKREKIFVGVSSCAKGHKDDVIGEYFNENGIIAKETKGFSDL